MMHVQKLSTSKWNNEVICRVDTEVLWRRWRLSEATSQT